MSNGTKGFGSKVIGHEAAEAALRADAGGGNSFGVRVIGAITGPGPTNDAKRASQFGTSIVDGAHASDTEGNPGDTVSVEQLRDILAENPTFLDSLYEAELAREDGARPDALNIFYEVERGIKGQMRPDVMAEIRGLLGQKGIDAEARANEFKVRRDAQAAMAKRTEENALLADADRVRDLVERNKNVELVREQQERGDLDVQVGLTTEQQEARIAKDAGVTLPGQESAVSGKVPAKPEGPTNPETQQPGPRLGVPKLDQGSAAGGTGSADTSPATGATSDEVESKAALDAKIEEIEGMKKSELEDYLGEDAPTEGTGSNGNVIVDDLVKAAKKKARADAKK